MKKVLIIDDDEVFRKTTGGMLSSHGYVIIEAKDGQEGLEVTEKEKPDLILLDLVMPNMGGMNFLKILQQNDPSNKIPVLITSNFSEGDRVSQGMEYGVRGYIVKSNESLKTIVSAVESIVGKP